MNFINGDGDGEAIGDSHRIISILKRENHKINLLISETTDIIANNFFYL